MPQIDPKAAKRLRRIAFAIAAFGVLLLVCLAILNPYVDYLWFAEDMRQPEVFTKTYTTQSLLFAPAFAIAWALLHFSLSRALKLTLIYLKSPETGAQVFITNAMHFVQDRGKNIVRIAAPFLAYLFASGFSKNWLTFLEASHGKAFHRVDPLFGYDLSFYVFQLPWYRVLASYSFGLLLLTTIFTVLIYAGLQGLAALGKVELTQPSTRTHLGFLLAGLGLVLGLQIFLRTFEYGLMPNQQFTGAGYSAMFGLQAQRLLAVCVVLTGIYCLVGSRSKQFFRIFGYFAAACIAVGIIGRGIVPAVTQRLIVEPNKISVEGPFAKRAIEMTRFGFALDNIKSQDFPVKPTPDPSAILGAQSTLDNMRLWDPEVVRQSIEVLQGLKPYYTFNDVDVDRYRVNGKTTMVMLSPRDIRLDGLSENARTWINEKLQYTHGFGVAMSSVNSASGDGEPTFLVSDIPPTAPSDVPLDQPRIYFSDYRAPDGSPTDEYVLVNSNQPEFDYPAQDGERTNKWEGGRGVSIGGFFRRLALSIVLGDGNLLVSSNITGNTKLLLHRGVMARCSRLYPFLHFDNDPYIVLSGGKVYWIVDGYTVTDRIPYSEQTDSESGGSINYIRNPCKIVVDAYSGETNAYVIDPGEPILATYASIYPSLFKPVQQLPAGLREHFRYPEDMFTLQAQALAQYHVTDPVTFLNNNDAWAMPRQLGANGSESFMPPYYVQMRLPNEIGEGFLLMLPFTPRQKANMSGWLAAHCDPDRYGELVLYNFAKGANVAGAEQMETTINSDPKVNAAKLQLQGGGQTDVIIGNLLVIPIGDSVMYAESLFPKSRSSGLQAMPRLKKVVLALNGRIEIGDNYREALNALFPREDSNGNNSQPSPQQQSGRPTQQPSTTQLQGIRQALDLLDKADAALKQGDWAKYGEYQKQAKQRLRQLAGR